MRQLLLSLCLLILGLACHQNPPSRPGAEDRVKTAYTDKKAHLQTLLKNNGIALENVHLFIRGFKKEQKLEIWAKAKSEKEYTQLLGYDFCDSSGTLGPKRKEGDFQIPEGLYHIDRLNPKSNFYLSLGLNYPNASDELRGDPQKPGSDIFIHGGCATIGCIPITNEKIKELYVLVEQAQNNGQKQIPVHLFPSKKMDTQSLEQLALDNPQWLSFWKELQSLYQAFEQSRQVPSFTIDRETGAYHLDKI